MVRAAKRAIAVLTAVAVCACGCRRGEDTVRQAERPPVKAADEDAFVAAIEKARASGTDTFDVKLFPRIGDVQVARLRELPLLRSLTLDKASVTDKGLKVIAALPELRYLSLWQTQVTDAGLPALAGLSKLEALRLDGL